MQKDLKDLLIEELHDLLSSEEQIVEALPEVVKASESADLREAFDSHLKETKGQVQRLHKAFQLLEVEKKEKHCKAMKGLIQECKEVLTDFKTKSAVRDAALISKVQRIEHYEISAYGTVRTFAKELGLKEVAHLLQATLNEEGHADRKLTRIAQGGLFRTGVNIKAKAPEENKSYVSKKKISARKKSKGHAPKQKAKGITPKRKAPLAKKLAKKH